MGGDRTGGTGGISHMGGMGSSEVRGVRELGISGLGIEGTSSGMALDTSHIIASNS